MCVIGYYRKDTKQFFPYNHYRESQTLFPLFHPISFYTNKLGKLHNEVTVTLSQ